MNKIIPDCFKHIAIIAPAGPAEREKVMNGLELLRSWGKKVTVMPNVFKGTSEKYLSASLTLRLSDLHTCWLDSSIDLILCTRGGYGSAQLLEYIDWDLLRSRSLPLVGYSDITALHLGMLTKNAGVPITAPMCAKLTEALIEDINAAYTAKYLNIAFNSFSEPVELFSPASAASIRVIKPGTVTARPIAANLAVMAAQCGTGFFPDISTRMLIIEDINEPAYKIDRYLTQLQQAGILSQCKGLLFGSFTGCGTNVELQLIFEKFATMVNGPVLAEFPFGHTFPIISINMSRPLHITEDGRIFTA